MGDRKRGRYLYHAKDVRHGDYQCSPPDKKCVSFDCPFWVSKWVTNDSGKKKVEYGYCSDDRLVSMEVSNG